MTTLDEELDQTVQMIWLTMLGEPLPRPVAPGVAPDGSDRITSFVIFEGAYEGAVLLRCSRALAVRLTRQFFASEADPSPSDVRDAIGELANMIGGNVKAALPQPSRIGLPVVAFGRDYELEVVGTELAGSMTYECDGEVLTVTLVRRSDDEVRL